MALALSLLLSLALCALLAYREWDARRQRAEVAEERAAWIKERRELNQRIQAPEIAVTEAVRASRPKRKPVRPIAADNDAAFAAREEKRG